MRTGTPMLAGANAASTAARGAGLPQLPPSPCVRLALLGFEEGATTCTECPCCCKPHAATCSTIPLCLVCGHIPQCLVRGARTYAPQLVAAVPGKAPRRLLVKPGRQHAAGEGAVRHARHDAIRCLVVRTDACTAQVVSPRLLHAAGGAAIGHAAYNAVRLSQGDARVQFGLVCRALEQRAPSVRGRRRQQGRVWCLRRRAPRLSEAWRIPSI